MRAAGILLLAVALLLLFPTFVVSGGHIALRSPQGAPGLGLLATSTSRPTPRDAGPLIGFNQTVNVATPAVPATSVPTSAIPMTPPIVPPATTPVVMTFLTTSKTCCVLSNFSAPTGLWDLVELKYTGQAVGGVFDSSFRAYLDQVQVMFGTTPEYGEWNVTLDVTPYVSLLNGTFNFTFLLAAATNGGYFLSSVSLWFYPVAGGEAPPIEPTLVVPIFHRVFASTLTPTLYSSATVPTDVVNATLELWTYAEDSDEFWYFEKPAFRLLSFSVDGQGLVSVAPFPYINTGGTDPFIWKPITGAFTISNRPYDFNISGALGMIEGTHNYSANLSGVAPGANWLVGAALLLYTSPAAGPAVTTSYAFSAPPPAFSTSTLRTQSTASQSSAISSSWSVGSTMASAATFENLTFSSTLLTPSNWNNLTLSEGWSVHTVYQVGNTDSDWADHVAFRLGMDDGGSFTETSNTGGGYPIFGNFTTELLGLVQEWNETTVLRSSAFGSASPPLSRAVDNLVLGGNNIYGGTEELTSPGVAILLTTSLLRSETTDELRLDSVGGPLPYLFDHLVAGSAYQPADPNGAETVSVNRILSPLAARVVVTPQVVDVGDSVSFVASGAGGAAPYSFTYVGLPTGCTSANESRLLCTPVAPGLFVVSVTLSDGSGATAPWSWAVLQVNTQPIVSIALNRTAIEVSASGDLSAVISGGTPPYLCRWSIAGAPAATADCDSPVPWSPAATGSVEINLTVEDGAGSVSNSSRMIVVASPPVVVIWPVPQSNTSVGDTRALFANVSGGVGPYSYVWFVNGVLAQQGSNASWGEPLQVAGEYVVDVTVTDSEGGTATAGPVAFNVTVGSAASPPAGAAAASSPDPLILGLVLGIAVGAAVGAAVVLILRRQRR